MAACLTRGLAPRVAIDNIGLAIDMPIIIYVKPFIKYFR